jgi:hypothetical protein
MSRVVGFMPLTSECALICLNLTRLVVLMRVFLAFCALSAAIAAELSPAEIVRRATERESDNAQLRRQYTYRESMWQRIAKKDGEVRSEERKVHDVFFIGGEDFRKLVEKDGRPLSGKEAAKEQARLDREIEKYRRESPAATQKRAEKERREQREFNDQVAEGFDFHLIREEPVSGRPCYRIHAEPKPGFRFKGEAKVLGKVRGDIWVDKEHYNWARVEVETIDTVTGMGGLLRIAKGTTVKAGRTFVNNEVWFPDRINVQANARAAFFISAAVEMEMLFSGFRKYTVDSKVTVADE